MIQVKDITKKYGSFVAVDKLNFEINDGEIIGLLGPNGAGKSTTMNILTGFIEATEGSVLIDGENISENSKEAKKKIGYMPENIPLCLELKVKEFIKFMAELRYVPKNNIKSEVEETMKKVGLMDVQNRLIKNLSRGYKQRVSLAGAIVGNPKIIILDEPTVGLDPKQIIETRELIKSLGKDHTIILSSHILSEVSQVCEKVIIINKGKLVVIDTPENLEKIVKEKNNIIITVEDKNEKMMKLQDDYEEIIKIELIKDNEDGTKQYSVLSDSNIDLRKKLFEILPQNNITIFELKKEESNLEDAFIKIINKETKGGEN